VSDIVKGALSGTWALIVGWFLPSAIALALFGIFVLPTIDSLPLLHEVASASSSSRALVLLVASVVLGLILSAAQTPLYRVLEGYLAWPGRLRDRAIEKHRQRRAKLHDEVTNRSEQAGAEPGVVDGLLLEKYFRYPDDERQIAPTMLGNAIRRFEYYGRDRYQLDSQRLWYQLRTVVPEGLAKDVDNARAGVDFFICLLYTLSALSLVSLATLLYQRTDGLRLGAMAVVAGASAVGCYWGAVTATDGWSAAVKAMVDLGRTKLAESYGLNVPKLLEDEREMWQVVGWLVGFPYSEELAKAIDQYRKAPKSSSDEISKPGDS
jgi:hypothetical protein